MPTKRELPQSSKDALSKDGGIQSMQLVIEELRASNRQLVSQNKELAQANDSLNKQLLESASNEGGENRFRQYFDLGLIGMAMTSLDKNWIEVNDTLINMFGYDRQDFLKLTWAELTYPDDLEADVAQFNRVLAGESEGYSMEKRFIHKDGSILYAEISVNAVRHSDGSVDYFLALVHDVSERKQSERSIHGYEARIRTLLEGSPVCNKMIDLNSRLQYMSASGRKDLAISDSANINGSVYPPSFFSESARKQLSEHLERAKIGETCSLECPVEDTKGNELWFHTTFVPVFNDDGEVDYVIGASVNITERKIAEKEKEVLQQQLTQAQKMEAIGVLAGGIAHDFNNILGAIRGNLELCLEDLGSDEPGIRSYLEAANQSTHRGADLVEQILVFSGHTEEKVTTVDIASVVSDTLKFLRATVPSTIEIRQSIESDCGTMLAARIHIHQIIMNLGVNAFQAMDENGGVLEISVKKVKFSSDNNLELPTGAYAYLAVKDSGCGIHSEKIGKIFDPFYTTKQVGAGTGLGLSVVHGLVESFGGKILVDSEINKGTTFTVYLPVTGEEASKESLRSKEIYRGSERILFIDDESSITSVYGQLLKKFGYEVVIKSNSEEALECFRLEPESYDLVITDLTMPNMTGLELAKEISSIRPGIPVILSSGFREQISTEVMGEAGINGVLKKPFGTQELCSKIREILD